jgi:hypothetical protein
MGIFRYPTPIPPMMAPPAPPKERRSNPNPNSKPRYEATFDSLPQLLRYPWQANNVYMSSHPSLHLNRMSGRRVVPDIPFSYTKQIFSCQLKMPVSKEAQAELQSM